MPRGKLDSTNQNHYPDLGSAASSVWNLSLVSQTSFGGKTNGSVAKWRLFSQAKVGETGKVLGQTYFLFFFNCANLLRQNYSLKYSIYSVIVSDSR